MDYCINVWGQSSKSLLQKIYQIQKRILRNVSCDYLCEGNELFHKFNNIMTIYERIEFQTAILVYKCLLEVVPSYLQNFFEFSGNNHNYNLRNNDICAWWSLNLIQKRYKSPLVILELSLGITCHFQSKIHVTCIASKLNLNSTVHLPEMNIDVTTVSIYPHNMFRVAIFMSYYRPRLSQGL